MNAALDQLLDTRNQLTRALLGGQAGGASGAAGAGGAAGPGRDGAPGRSVGGSGAAFESPGPAAF
jgi:hypothetical protein